MWTNRRQIKEINQVLTALPTCSATLLNATTELEGMYSSSSNLALSILLHYVIIKQIKLWKYTTSKGSNQTQIGIQMITVPNDILK